MQSEAKELAKDGAVGFHFKLHGGKHSFESSSVAERNSWYVAFEKAIEEAAAAEKEIVESESYKEQLEKLSKLFASRLRSTFSKRGCIRLFPLQDLDC